MTTFLAQRDERKILTDKIDKTESSSSLKALLLCLFAIRTFPCLAQESTAPPPQRPPVTSPSTSQDTQSPAPIVRPRPIIIKPRAAPSAADQAGAPSSPDHTSATSHKPAGPKPDAPANGILRIEGAAPKSTVTPKSVSSPAAASNRQLAPGTAAVPFNRTTIVLDASHGGIDGGSRITDTLQEKDVDLAFAFKLRSLLAARGFTVLLTRETDTATPADRPTPLTLDDRAGIANHVHPVACLLLHATGSGKGVHLYSSELAPLPLQPTVVPWLTAQASWVDSSQALQRQLGLALSRADVPLVMSRASIRPLDSLTCPALVLELAPNGSEKESVNDAGYQQRIANAIAAAMVFWQSQAHPPDRQVPIPTVSSPSSSIAPNPVAPGPGAQP